MNVTPGASSHRGAIGRRVLLRTGFRDNISPYTTTTSSRTVGRIEVTPFAAREPPTAGASLQQGAEKRGFSVTVFLRVDGHAVITVILRQLVLRRLRDEVAPAHQVVCGGAGSPSFDVAIAEVSSGRVVLTYCLSSRQSQLHRWMDAVTPSPDDLPRNARVKQMLKT